MSIKKYNTFEEAERDIYEINPDQKYFKHIFALFRMKQLKAMHKCPHGVFKYKTIQDAQADAEKWLRTF